MSDHHFGGLSALTTIFPEIVTLRCRFHLDQNIERKLRSLNLKAHIPYIRWAIKMLSETNSKNEFDLLWSLLEPEIKEITQSSDFMKYLTENVISDRSLWFKGASFIGKQKCNNSLEAINKYLKTNWTKEESKSVQEFLIIMEKSFDYYVNICKEEKCMPNGCKFLRQYYQKASCYLEKKQIFKFNEHIFAFIRIPKKFKKNEQIRLRETELRIKEVTGRIEFAKKIYERRFSDLPTFLKICYYFNYYDSFSRICSCKTFANRGICKHQLASEMFMKKIKNPYREKIVQGTQIGRPKNLQ